MTLAGDLHLKRNDLGFVSEKKLENNQIIYSFDKDYGELSQIDYRFKGKTKFIQDFKRDALGRISEMYNESGRQIIHYDVAGRFTGRSQLGSTKPFSQFIYDKNGNRVRGHEDDRTFTAEYDDQDRLIKYNQTEYGYNKNGDRVIEETGGVSVTYTWDALGNLRSVALPNRTINYHIDAHNRRTTKLHNNAPVARYVWLDQLRIGAELYGDRTIKKFFVYADGVNSPEYMIYDDEKFLCILGNGGSVTQMRTYCYFR